MGPLHAEKLDEAVMQYIFKMVFPASFWQAEKPSFSCILATVSGPHSTDVSTLNGTNYVNLLCTVKRRTVLCGAVCSMQYAVMILYSIQHAAYNVQCSVKGALCYAVHWITIKCTAVQLSVQMSPLLPVVWTQYKCWDSPQIGLMDTFFSPYGSFWHRVAEVLVLVGPG